MFSKHCTYNDVDKKQGKATSYFKIPYIKKLASYSNQQTTLK